MRAKIEIPTVPAISTTETPSEIDAKWDAMCTEYKSRITTLNAELIDVYYDVGIQVIKMLRQPNSWGSRTSDDLAARLDMSVSTVRCATRFAQTMGSRHALSSLIDCGLKWTAAVALILVKDPALRHSLCLEYKKNDWTVEDLKARVQEVIPAEVKDKPKKHGGLNWTTMFRKTASQADDLQSTLGSYLTFVDAYNGEDRKSDKATAAFDASISTLKDMHSKIGDILNKVDVKEIDVTPEPQ